MHTIDIPEHILDRPRQRRGTVEIFDRIDASKTALLVIDMQKYFLRPGGIIEVPASRDIVANINRLALALRAAGGRVFWTRHSFTREWTAWYGAVAKGDFADQMVAESAPGADGYAIGDNLDVRPEDTVFDKVRYSAMLPESCPLGAHLRRHGCDTVIVAGTLTNVCCESTARDAMMMNYRTIFLSDGNATRTDADHNATLANIVQIIGDVRTTDEVVSLIQPGARLTGAAE